ncbi:MAG: DUF368 domain-containing protein [Bacteroidales bacterium]|nr:DUF368 domain-containing protein [Bacteroidales bacterium]
MKNQFIPVALKGFGMGAANVVPGVSGGTIALLTGIYSQVVDAISALTDISLWKSLFKGQFKDFWQKINGSFLVALAVGVLASVFSLAKVMTYVLSYYPILTWAFFFGLIIASSIVMFRDIKGWGVKEVLFVILGAIIGVAVCTLSPTQTTNDLWFIFVCGAVAICTMILPGVSGSFVLLIFGKYDYIMNAISDFDLPILLVFGAGCLVGILAFAKLLHWLLGRWEKQTLLVLLGFVLGSLIRVWPWSDKLAIADAQLLRTGAPALELDLQIPGAIICCVVGIALVVGLELLSKKGDKKA